MAEVTKSIQQHHRLTVALIPEDIRKALPADERAERLIEVESLARRAANASDPALRRGYSTLAKAMLSARPRDEVAKEHRQLVAKAAGAPPGQAAALHRKAAELLEQHPPAPRRTPEEQARDAGPVRAGGATGLGQPRAAGSQRARPGDYPGRDVIKARPLTPVYDDRHRLTGVVAPGSIRQHVSKADRDTPMQPVFDENGNLVGIVDPADVQPVAGASKKPAPAAEPAEQPTADVAKAVFARAFLAGWRDAARAARTPAPRRPGQR